MKRIPRLHDMPTGARIVLGALIGVAIGGLLLLLRPTDLFESVELRFIDVRTRHFLATRPPDPRIVLAEITEADVRAVWEAWFQRWPWPLELNTQAFQLMKEAGVEAVVVDVFHFDHGVGIDDLDLKREPDAVSRRLFDNEEEQGAELGQAFAAFRFAGEEPPKGPDAEDPQRRAYEKRHGVALAYMLSDTPKYEQPSRVRAAEGKSAEAVLHDAPAGIAREGANLPASRIAAGAAYLGFANVVENVDGVVRTASATGRWGARPVPSLALAAAMLATGGQVRFVPGGVEVEDAYERLMDDGSFLVNFRGDPFYTYPTVPPANILRWAQLYAETGEMPAEAKKELAGKIVVWGVNIAGIEDIVTTPLSGKYHGPEYQATILDDLLHGDGRVRAGAPANALILFALTVLLGTLAGVLRSRLLPHLVPLLAALLLLVLAWSLFRRGTSIDVFTPLMGIVLTWVATSIVRVLTEGRRNRWLEGTFGRYLAPSIIEALKQDPELLVLGGQRRDITILFSDVANFTRLSESLSPDQTVSLLNRYLTAHSAAVMEEGGVVDKFEGDAVMAFFGDPVPTPTHALQACRAALAVFERLPSLRPIWESMGLTEFGIRIGINTGTAVVGNMGSEQRFDYTCMGDAVNLASRLEGANKAFRSGILIGSRTRAEAGAAILAKPIGDLVVFGRKGAEPVYELVAMESVAPADLAAHVAAFTRAHDAARAGDLALAMTALDEAERFKPGDGATDWLRGIVRGVMAAGEGVAWSGRVTLTGK